MATEVDRHTLASSSTTAAPRSLHSAAVYTAPATMAKNPLRPAVEIVEDRVYYMATKSRPTQDASFRRDAKGQKKQIHYYSIDNELVYWNFFLDFGPLNLGQLYRFCTKLNQKLQNLPNHIICFYSSTAPAKRANAVCLIGCWQILYLQRTPEQALNGFRLASSVAFPVPPAENSSAPPLSRRANPTISPLPPFHDASPCACTYELTVWDCLKGLDKAHRYGFFDFQDFDVEEYEHFEQVENGDLNWIVYGKILAFAGPSYERRVSPEGYCTLAPSDYIPYFKKKHVSLVVRLNRKAYHEEDFQKAGINHLEQFYVDGSCPPMKILDRVVEGFESVPVGEAFAVHCKAGLGRTGTCIGAYLMKHYRFTASEVIAWMRICRPGCVIGPQQQFLKEIEQRMWQLGAVEGSLESGKQICSKLTTSFNCISGGAGIMPCQDDVDGSGRVVNVDDEAVVGRAGQADGLLSARTRNRNGSGKSRRSAPPTPETAKPKSKQHHNHHQQQQPVMVTPDPPGKSKCDGTRWYI
ncbi:specificity protein phosphatase CDC14C [Seminavis robusta]|uniref:protein-tyrosine-phosphatase n=1 Tax=Seminavis robusta TaxID=568900 RepID=A0A9N8H9H0_9STRA|nr:specificity protein phosphatase CDC14C [Seminavis robusta]|eukprot:Sro117_g057410.1 specificity protein phosphatase CDC14C (524) ;mRNA; f:61875-63915